MVLGDNLVLYIQHKVNTLLENSNHDHIKDIVELDALLKIISIDLKMVIGKFGVEIEVQDKVSVSTSSNDNCEH